MPGEGGKEISRTQSHARRCKLTGILVVPAAASVTALRLIAITTVTVSAVSIRVAIRLRRSVRVVLLWLVS